MLPYLFKSPIAPINMYVYTITMTRVRIICDSNFKKTEDVEKSVEKVLKMFSEHFVKKMAPLNEESDMECVYIYDGLTPEQVRLLKRLLNHNKTLLNFKEIIISKPGDADNESVIESDVASDVESDVVESDIEPNIESDVDSDVESDVESETSLARSFSPRSSKSSKSSKSSFASNVVPASASNVVPSVVPVPKSDNKLDFSQVAQKLRELADEFEDVS